MITFFFGLVVGIVLGAWGWPHLAAWLDYTLNGER
jgi:hypothetical protein